MLTAAAVGGALAVLIPIAVVFACTGGAYTQLDSKAGAAEPGDVISGTGTGFSITGSIVQLHWNSLTGPVLWSGSPASNGAISFSFTVPQVSPGNYFVAATQYQADGTPVPGTPGRGGVTVPGPASAPPPASSGSTNGNQTNTQPAQLPAVSAASPAQPLAQGTAVAPDNGSAPAPQQAAPAAAGQQNPGPAVRRLPKVDAAPSRQQAGVSQPPLALGVQPGRTDPLQLAMVALAGLAVLMAIPMSGYVIHTFIRQRGPAKTKR